MKNQEQITEARPPIVAIVGHIDHGKSTLLDYIRQTNVVAGEAGGITQHLSAYEALHTNESGAHRITFLDTPGHEAFSAMRSRGLEAADVAILVVSAEEGAKLQTVEALRMIQEAKIPYVVAFTKIDKPGANVEKAKFSLLEQNIYLEGMGGEVPWVALSSKTGEGVPELLDLILLAGELEGLQANASLPGAGLVIEAHVDRARGNTATLIVRDGSVETGKFVVAGSTYAPVRIMENFLGKAVKKAGPGSPVSVVGFSSLPQVGSPWYAVETKKKAEADAADARFAQKILPLAPSGRLSAQSGAVGFQSLALESSASKKDDAAMRGESNEEVVVPIVFPIVIKTDVAGVGEAVVYELEKIPKDARLEVRVVHMGQGAIGENDVKLASGGKEAGLVVGFNVRVEKEARDLSLRMGVKVEVFDVIYKLTEFLAEEIEKRRPRERIETVTGRAKVLKFFSTAKGRVVIGGRVEEGVLKEGVEIKILRRDVELGRGVLVSLQAQKMRVKKVESGEFGAQIKTQAEPAPGDYLEAFEIVLK